MSWMKYTTDLKKKGCRISGQLQVTIIQGERINEGLTQYPQKPPEPNVNFKE